MLVKNLEKKIAAVHIKIFDTSDLVHHTGKDKISINWK